MSLRRTGPLWLGLLTALPAWAADPCDELPKPSVVVQRLDSVPALNLRYGYRALTALESPRARPGRQVLGLTRGTASVRFASTTPVIVSADGRWECGSPQITLTYGLAPLTVHVAREFPPDSCAYKVIHAHEMRHVETYQAHLAAIEPDLTATLNRRFTGGAPWRGPAGQLARRLQQELDTRWLPYVQREIAKVEVAQALIDTPEEYDRVANACDGEISKRLKADTALTP
ncbi:MAG: hypothetical protein ACK4FP_11010 [Azonexus sp.]